MKWIHFSVFRTIFPSIVKGNSFLQPGHRFRKSVSVLILAAVLFAGLLGVRAYNSHRFHLEKETRLMMDTYVTIYAVGLAEKTSQAMDAAFRRMEEIDAKFSIHNPKSPLYAFNHHSVAVTDPEILHVVRQALQISRESGGAFDVTISPLIELWGFYGNSPALPSEKKIAECRSKIGYRNLILENNRLEKRNEETRIDLGAIAKGYGIAQAAKVLKENGATSALIEAGGDVYALGRKGGALWNVGVRSPRSTDLVGYLEVEDLTVVGSGDYERFFMKDGRRYHHIFDPATGYPAQGVSGVTLIHPDPVLADAWATALFIMGPVRGLEKVEEIPGMEAILVTESGERLFSSGLKNQLMNIPKAE